MMSSVARSNVFIVDPFIQLMVGIPEEEVHEILQTDLTPMLNLLLDVRTLFQDQRKEDQRKEVQETLKIWLQLLLNSLREAKSILHRYDQRQRCLDCLVGKPGRLSKEIKDWKQLFDCIFLGFQNDLPLFVGAHQIVHRDPIQAMSPEDSVRQLSKDEALMLFRRIAFKNDSVPENIKEYATNIAEECNGFPLAITLVAAAMVGKTTENEWETSLSSIKNADLSFTDTLPRRFDPKLYQCLIWSYNALPNSDVKNCFLYCAMYGEYEEIPAEDLVQMWIVEGLVKRRKHHLMDMAIGRSYVNLLVDRFFFQNASDEAVIRNVWNSLERQSIRVHDVIRDVAIYIGEKEESCILKGGRELPTMPDIHNEDCKRMSLHNSKIENLPSDLRCPKLVSLFLTSHAIKGLPSGFLESLTSLKVLNLSNNRRISSIPSSVGELKHLEFLRLSGLYHIQDLPKEICNLSSLQFLDLSSCLALRSLPSEIGELKTLKHLSLKGCRSLVAIPHEISRLTLLSTLDAYASAELSSVEAEVNTLDAYASAESSSVEAEVSTLDAYESAELSSVEAKSEAASIWTLKSLPNLTMLRMKVKVDVEEGMASTGIKAGIMGTWLEMRHLYLQFPYADDVMSDVLPKDMQKMSKLQSFIMENYNGLSLPEYSCNFHYLEHLELFKCPHLKELPPLGKLPNPKLVLNNLDKVESIATSSNNGVWNESILPNLRVLRIWKCPSLKRLPKGMEKLVNLTTIYGEEEWWQELIFEDDNMKLHLQNLFRPWY